MIVVVRGIIFSIALLLSGCANNQTPTATTVSNSTSPYAGNYSGTETFDSGVFPLKIYIKANGKVKIVDIDNLSAHGKLADNKFTVKRYGSSPMVFEGSISDSVISGTTYGNRFLGDGTFKVILQQ